MARKGLLRQNKDESEGMPKKRKGLLRQSIKSAITNNRSGECNAIHSETPKKRKGLLRQKKEKPVLQEPQIQEVKKSKREIMMERRFSEQSQSIPKQRNGLLRQTPEEKSSQEPVARAMNEDFVPLASAPIFRQTNSETEIATASDIASVNGKISYVSANAVTTTGNQDIQGNKTFYSKITLKTNAQSSHPESFNDLDNQSFVIGTDNQFSVYTSGGIDYYAPNTANPYKLKYPEESGTFALEESIASAYAPSGHKHDSIWNEETAVSAYGNNAWLRSSDGETMLGNPVVTGSLTAVPTYGGDTAYLDGSMEFKGPFGPFDEGEATYYVPTTSPDPTTENEAMQGQWCIYSGPALGLNKTVLIYSQNMYAEISNLNSEHPTIGSFQSASTTGSITMARQRITVYSMKKLATESKVGDIITTCAVRLRGNDLIHGYKTFYDAIEQDNTYAGDYILLHPRYDYKYNDSVVSIGSRDAHEHTDYGSGGITRVKGDPQTAYELKFPVETSGTFALEETISGKYIPYTATSGVLVGAPNNSEATGLYAIGLGSAVYATGDRSVAIGGAASALALNAVAIGGTARASAINSLAMVGGKAYGANTVAIGAQSQTSGNFSMAIGRGAKANDNYAIAIGSNTSDAEHSITMGYKTHSYPASKYSFTWNGNPSLGMQNEYAANGGGTFNINPSAGISGFYIGTKNLYTILSESTNGQFVPIVPITSIIHGVATEIKVADLTYDSFSPSGVGLQVGRFSYAYRPTSVANGYGVQADSDFSHAEGYLSWTLGEGSHAEGRSTLASGGYSHSEGYDTKAFGYASHAEGYSTSAVGMYSHAEGTNTSAIGQNSHSDGISAIARHNNSFVWNGRTTGDYLANYESNGNGTFNIYPSGGTEGFYIAHHNLPYWIKSQALTRSELADYNIRIGSPFEDGTTSGIVIGYGDASANYVGMYIVDPEYGVPPQLCLGDGQEGNAGANISFSAIDRYYNPEDPADYYTIEFPTSGGKLALDSDLRYAFYTPEQTITNVSAASLTLQDRSMNQVAFSSAISAATVSFPPKISGKARDFFVRLTIVGESVPAITWQEADGGAVDFEVDDDSWADIEQGVNILMFTETTQGADQ